MSNFLTAIDNCAQLNSKVKTPAKEKNFPSLSFGTHNNSYSIVRKDGILACIFCYISNRKGFPFDCESGKKSLGKFLSMLNEEKVNSGEKWTM